MRKPVSKSFKQKWAEAQRLLNKGDFESELRVRKELAGMQGDRAIVWATLAESYAANGEKESAEKEYRKAVDMAPECELVSLCLFHFLWDHDRRVEALDEIKRFMSVSHSEDYVEIIREINEKPH